MHAFTKFNRKLLFSISIIFILSMSFIGSTNTMVMDSPTKKGSSLVAAGLDQYTDEELTGYIEGWKDNTTSSGIELTSYVIGEPDGLAMEMIFLATYEFAVFKINGSVMSNSLTLRNCIDEAGSDTLLWIYSWINPYTEPNPVVIPDNISSEHWTILAASFLTNGDVFFSYENTSIEYLLLVGGAFPAGIGSFISIDAIEVHGYTNVMADEQNDGLPDIWQYPDVDMNSVSIDIDLFGHTWGIMGLVGVAPTGSTNLEFLTPFIKLGVIEPTSVDESHFYVICQCELTLPWSGADEEDLEWPYMDFLGSHDLLNMTFINGNSTILDEFSDAFDKYVAHDGRIRTYFVIDYTLEDYSFNPHDYYGAQGQINAEYNTLDVKTNTPDTAQEKFDLDVSIVLDIVENVLDAVQQGGDLTEQFMSKIIGFIQGKIMDGIGKALLEKITKKALKTALKAILSITTIKDIVVKGSKILEKLGVTLPDWLRKARDFVESIPFIDPPVEIWKVRLTFENETTGLPILGYDYINNVSIYTHPQGIYFGDTYSAQVILSSRDIFPVTGRIQSLNASRTITGNLYVEDLGLLEATRARSSLEPGESAEGRMYTIPPDGSVVISQCLITVGPSFPSTVELGTQFNITLSVSDENGTALSDETFARAAINNMPNTMVELRIQSEPDGTLTVMVDTGTLGVHPDDHMIAALYKPVGMFHDYWNFTFVLADTVSPAIWNVTAVFNEALNRVVFSAKVTDYDLNTGRIILSTIDGPLDTTTPVNHSMTYNGSHYVVSIERPTFTSSEVYYYVLAFDNSGNHAESEVKSIRFAISELGPLGVFIAAGVGVAAVVGLAVYVLKRPGR